MGVAIVIAIGLAVALLGLPKWAYAGFAAAFMTHVVLRMIG